MNNQMLYYFLLKPWHYFLGDTEIAFRGFSAMVSVAGIVIIFLLGKQLFGAKAGLIAALILAFHPASIRYAQEARSYSLAIFLILLSSFYLARVIDGGSRGDMIAWIIFTASSFYSHFFAGLIFEVQLIAILSLGLTELKKRKGLMLATSAIVLLALPVIFFMIREPKSTLLWIAPISISRVFELAVFLAGGSKWLLGIFSFVILYLAIILIKSNKKDYLPVLLVLLWTILPLTTMALVSLKQPILIERYVLFTVPGLALAVGFVFGMILNQTSKICTASIILILMLILSIDIYEIHLLNKLPYPAGNADWKKAATEVSMATLSGDGIIYNQSWSGLTFEYYFDRLPQRPKMLQTDILFNDAFNLKSISELDRVWLVEFAEVHDLSVNISNILTQNHPFVSWKEYNGVLRVILFDSKQRFHGDGSFGN
ncbi:glycosyltransferase family 39 protein [Geomonas agri]|uniref:glycosyltransferase family 39 protein n=1 Tax=Geomonas agri TaxID=2873702 RepID=UPI001CD480AB|nr:glycosyltransferase family 39 protein [Geomonas agri]